MEKRPGRTTVYVVANYKRRVEHNRPFILWLRPNSKSGIELDIPDHFCKSLELTPAGIQQPVDQLSDLMAI